MGQHRARTDSITTSKGRGHTMNITSPLGKVLRDDDGMRLEYVRTFPDPIDDGLVGGHRPRGARRVVRHLAG